jgi:catechol 1,2-dioxygenase
MSLIATAEVKELLGRAAGLDSPEGNDRLKKILHRVITDTCRTIEELDITATEFWTAMSYLTRLGQANEAGLLVAGLGIEHFYDLVLDEKERQANHCGGTPRTIEGPLWVEGAPVAESVARLDQDPEEGVVLFMQGQVKDLTGNPLPEAIVDVWHANTKGNYSFFDPSQSAWNLRRRIQTDNEGRYRFRSIMPSGYGCPPNGPTQELLNRIGRHGQRPAHIHFFVEAPGYRKLTTQINLPGDKYLRDDFAFATRDELIVKVARNSDPKEIKELGLNAPFATIEFDFAMVPENSALPDTSVAREHAMFA